MAQIKLIAFAKTANSTAAPLNATALFCSNLVVQNIDAANPVYIGDSTVADTTGLKIAAGTSISLDTLLAPTAAKREINLLDLYVVCSAAQTAPLRIAYTKETNPNQAT